MKYLFPFLTLLFLLLNVPVNAQCPEGIEATILNIAEDAFGKCSFDLEISYSANSTNNSSISFTISTCGGRDLLTTACYQNLQDDDSPYAILIDDPALSVLCPVEICVTYTAWTTPVCDPGNECTPLDNTIPVDGLLSLPVKLAYFSGQEERFKKVKLEWVTVAEEQNEYFVIEHSIDGQTFREVGQIDGNGTSISEHYYSFWDEFPYSGENYYRLKQVNFDESFEYSDVITVVVGIDMVSPLMLAPSVASEAISLIFNQQPKENSIVEVFNSTGLNILNVSPGIDVHVINLDVSTFKPGMYFIRVPIGREFIIKKFVKIAD